MTIDELITKITELSNENTDFYDRDIFVASEVNDEIKNAYKIALSYVRQLDGAQKPCEHCDNFCGYTHVNYYSHSETERSQGHIDPINYCPHCGRKIASN